MSKASSLAWALSQKIYQQAVARRGLEDVGPGHQDILFPREKLGPWHLVSLSHPPEGTEPGAEQLAPTSFPYSPTGLSLRRRAGTGSGKVAGGVRAVVRRGPAVPGPRVTRREGSQHKQNPRRAHTGPGPHTPLLGSTERHSVFLASPAESRASSCRDSRVWSDKQGHLTHKAAPLLHNTHTHL